MSTLAVPQQIEDVTVERAWPMGDGDAVTLRFEGRDTEGSIRAGVASFEQGAIASTDVLPPGVDPKLPALAEAPGELIGHRYGKRAVLRDGDRFLKVVRPKKAADVVERNTLGAEIAAAAGLAAAVPQPISDGLIATKRVPGVSLAESSADPVAWMQAWHSFMVAWPRFATHEASVPVHSPEREAAVLLEWFEGALDRGVLVDPGTARSSAHRIADQLATGHPDRLLTSHRDLHEAQLLFDDATGALGILDLDTLAKAEAALDLGNLAVHAIWKVAQGVWERGQGDVVVHAVSATAENLEVNQHRFKLAQSATALRLAAVWAYRPRWQAFAQRWLETWLTHPVLG